MEFGCPKCQAQYTISDHHVRGGSGTVPCRHCGSVIELRWPEGAAAPLPPRLVAPKPATPVAPRAPLPPPPVAPPPRPPRRDPAGSAPAEEESETVPFVDSTD